MWLAMQAQQPRYLYLVQALLTCVKLVCLHCPIHAPHPHLPMLLALQVLYKSKIVTDQAAGQWRKPCPFELQAALQSMINTKPTHSSSANDTPRSPDTTSNSTSSTPTAAFAAAGGSGGSVSEDLDSPVRQSSSSSSEIVAGSLFSSASLDSGVMNNAGVAAAAEGKTELAIIFLLDSSGSVGDGECRACVVVGASVQTCAQYAVTFYWVQCAPQLAGNPRIRPRNGAKHQKVFSPFHRGGLC